MLGPGIPSDCIQWKTGPLKLVLRESDTLLSAMFVVGDPARLSGCTPYPSLLVVIPDNSAFMLINTGNFDSSALRLALGCLLFVRHE